MAILVREQIFRDDPILELPAAACSLISKSRGRFTKIIVQGLGPDRFPAAEDVKRLAVHGKHARGVGAIARRRRAY